MIRRKDEGCRVRRAERGWVRDKKGAAFGVPFYFDSCIFQPAVVIVSKEEVGSGINE
jgi:hypothetical protein